MSRFRAFLYSLLFLALTGLLFTVNWLYASRFEAGTDFLPLWQSTRTFLFQGATPYGELAALNAQTQAYGRAARPLENPLRADQPLYLLLFYTPLAAIPNFILARALFLALLQASLAGVIIVSLRLSGWTPRRWGLLAFLPFALLNFPTLAALHNASPILLLTFNLMAALWALSVRADEAAGLFLALALVYIESTLPAVLFLLFWSLAGQRPRLAAGFGMTIILLWSLSQLLAPGWVWDLARAAYKNWHFFDYTSLFSVLGRVFPAIGARLAWGVVLALALMLALEWVLSLRRDVRWVFWTLSLTLAVTPLLGVPVPAPQRLVLFLPPALLVVSVMEQRWGAWGRWTALGIFSLLFWGLWLNAFFAPSSAHLWLSPLMIALLYWVRWWATQPPRLWIDQLAALGTHDPR